MSETPSHDARLPDRFEVGDWLVDRGLNEIRRGETVERLEPKVMELLVRLAEQAGETVSRDELLDAVWSGQHVVEGVLTRGASLLRQALGDDAQDPRYLQTVPKRGYRLIAPIRTAPVRTETVRTETVRPEAARTEAAQAATERPPAGTEERSPESRPRFLVAGLAVLLVAVSLFLLFFWLFFLRQGPPEPLVDVREPTSIAVLPLLNLAEDPAQDYFSLGMTEALITELAKVSGLRVVSRTSVMRFRGSTLPLPEIARQLGVSTLLQGSVLEVDGRARITTQLIRAETDDHLWVESYERELADVLSLQREIARAVAREVEVRLTPTEEARLSAARRVDAEAHRLYLKGRYHWGLRTPEDLALGRDFFAQAIDRDPAFAPAWAGLADTLIHLSGYSHLPPREVFPQAREAAHEALRLDPELAEAHASLALVDFNLEWDAQEAEAGFLKAIEFEPSYATAHQWYSELLSLSGRHDEALAEAEFARQLDPFSPIVRAALGQRLNAAGSFAAALERLGEALELQPRLAWAHRERAWVLTRLGRHGDALEARLEEMRVRGLTVAELEALESAVRESNSAGFWRWQIARLEGLAATEWVPSILRAEAHAGAVDADAALDWLERAAEERGLFLPHLIRSPVFDDLREHPRFQAVEREFARATARP